MSAVAQRATRVVERIAKASTAPVGSFTVRRALPGRERHSVGPWVFLDHFGPYRAKAGRDGVGAHPHAGIETVTYILSGRQRHRDSAGHSGIVGAGGAQWMTAGRGVVHAEQAVVETEADAVVHGLQLWTSLPRLQKLTEPAYQALDAASIPEVRREGAVLRVIGGELGGVAGPARLRMPLVLAHATLEPGAKLATAVRADFEMAAYVIEGEANFGDETTARAGAIAFFAEGGEQVAFANAGAGPLQLMLLGGAPAEGPLVFHGPFVMNNVEQARAADVAYRTGRMGVLDEE